ncbi:MAG: 16S rRNA (guanine(966)-N(2))-methyltransferase RsmD [Solobacterium sp.]|jgi:16S rRNA (guanine966-N2)-methyltransferase|nr:16S rRNA (guanine(966)-N(2))-methyltransferase RsmD [Solobacterium sp.]MCH4222598.1 16S rRNA (guanine(966)-N(2))-methyltransferase RsmD [Solobacterium sp.]MCH4265069.1 16S rRNA (guanine(966)-N(2))-methyltransferase RsmD [Solobacterium sp.]
MRIVAGQYSSRRLKTLEGSATRPTLDKVREAVFSSLGGMFDGGSCLDLYAGSGAVGLEALSRGMDRVYLVDSAWQAVKIIHENVSSLKADDQVQVLHMKDQAALNWFHENGIRFDLVYLDPPYAKEHNEEVMKLLCTYDLLDSNAVIAVESAKEDSHSDQIESLTRIKDAVYGITRITYYRKVE